MLRSLKQARYSADVAGPFRARHGGIHAFHFADSPLSGLDRAPRVEMGAGKSQTWTPMRAAVGDAPSPASQTIRPWRCSARIAASNSKEIASESSESERRAEAAERELMEWKTAQFMESHLGEEYNALIISVQKFGFFVELVEIFVEGLVSIDRLEETTGQRCVYRDRDHAIVIRTASWFTELTRVARQKKAASFHLGDRIKVRAERIDPFRHRVEFSLV